MALLARKLLDRTSDQVRDEISTNARSKIEAEASIKLLAAAYDDAVRQGDAAAEANERQRASLGRAVRRAELQIVDLESELKQLILAEEQSQRERDRAEAEAAVSKLVQEADERYAKPAAQIAEFLKELARVDWLAQCAGIPTFHARLRVKDGTRTPERTTTRTVWISPQGVAQEDKPRPAVSVLNPKTGDLVPQDRGYLAGWRSETREVKVPGEYTPGYSEPVLEQSVSLPGLRVGDPTIWCGDRITINRPKR